MIVWLLSRIPFVARLRERLEAAERERIAAEARWREAQDEARSLRDQVARLVAEQSEIHRRLIDHFAVRAIGTSVFEIADPKPAPAMSTLHRERIVTGSEMVRRERAKFFEDLRRAVDDGESANQ